MAFKIKVADVVTPSIVKVSAAAYSLSVVDGEILGAESALNIWMITYDDVGQYTVYWQNPVNVAYFPQVYDAAVNMSVLDGSKTSNSFVINAKDGAGNFVDPTSFNIEIKIIV